MYSNTSRLYLVIEDDTLPGTPIETVASFSYDIPLTRWCYAYDDISTIGDIYSCNPWFSMIYLF